jgi:hypothetical protein
MKNKNLIIKRSNGYCGLYNKSLNKFVIDPIYDDLSYYGDYKNGKVKYRIVIIENKNTHKFYFTDYDINKNCFSHVYDNVGNSDFFILLDINGHPEDYTIIYKYPIYILYAFDKTTNKVMYIDIETLNIILSDKYNKNNTLNFKLFIEYGKKIYCNKLKIDKINKILK